MQTQSAPPIDSELFYGSADMDTSPADPTQACQRLHAAARILATGAIRAAIADKQKRDPRIQSEACTSPSTP